jgi:methionyl-tRNA formyltransferase
MKIVFFGTPEFSTHFLKALHSDKDFSVIAVICQPDKLVGRKKILTAPETKKFALEHNIKVLQPISLKDKSVVNEISKINADIFVVVAYGKIIPDTILNIPKYGCINIHPSLLPKYRGPSPIQSAILNQEKETGVSIMLLDSKMDHGPILSQAKISVDDEEVPETLRNKVVEVGTPLLLETIKKYINGSIKPTAQNESTATICKLLARKDGLIDWTKSAEQIYAQIRALTPWPSSYSILNTGEKDKQIKILKAEISDKRFNSG